MAVPTELPTECHRFFSDCDARQLDTERNADPILARLLDYGDIAAARWALHAYGRERFFIAEVPPLFGAG